MIGQIIKVKNISFKDRLEISYYLYQYGTIVGTKKLRQQQKLQAFIIQFADNSRIWMLEQEIEFIKT